MTDERMEQEMNETLTREQFEQKVDTVLMMMEPGFDWEKHWESGGEMLNDLFRELVWQVPLDESVVIGYEAGGARIKETAKGLYRLLYLTRPKAIDFDDMYKGTLMIIGAKDHPFFVDVSLFKYELGLYWYVPSEALGGKGSCILAGRPGSDNGWHSNDPLANKFFEMVKRAAEYEWTVYPGNNFKV
jgi:hypothetical protein